MSHTRSPVRIEANRAIRWVRLRTASSADSLPVIQKRLAVARQEIAQWKNFDYLLISGSKQEDLRKTLAIVEAEKMRSTRSQPPEF